MSGKRRSAPIRSNRKTVSAYTADIVPAGLPEQLLNEKEYGERLAPLFDRFFPDSQTESNLAPFFRMLIRKHHLRSACDTACRTGQVLKMLNKSGITQLTGIDVSPAMLRESRKKIRSRIRYILSELTHAPAACGNTSYDLMVCLRDALPVILDDEALIDFFKNIRHHLTDNGVFVAEIFNYQKIWRRKERFQPILDCSAGKKSQLFFFMNDFHEELLVRNLMHLYAQRGHWHLNPISIPVRPLLPAEIEFLCREAGFSKWTFLGDYQAHPFSPNHSPYLITVAKK